MNRQDKQKQAFQDRLKRVSEGGPNTLGHVYVGIINEKTVKENNKKNSVQRMSLMMLILAFVLGAMAMESGRLGAFHYLTGDPAALIDLFGEIGGFIASNMGDLVIAMFLAIIFKYLFRLRGNYRGTALVVGLVSMMLGEVHLMARAPNAFSLMFSPSFVETTLAGGDVRIANMRDTAAILAN